MIKWTCALTLKERKILAKSDVTVDIC